MSDSSDNDAVEARRRLIAQSLKAQEVKSESESSDDSLARLKPVFVPKNKRVTLIEKEQREAQEAELERERKIEAEAFRQKQREEAIAEAIRQEAILAADEASGSINEWSFKPPPIGNEDTEEQYQLWKIRELKRVLAMKTGEED